MTIGSLFSGIGGLELGLERAGLGPVLFQVEIDPFCREVLEKHWPTAQRFEDVRSVGKANLPAVDVLCGGFPCQPVSLAGKGLAQKDARWLWPEFARIIRNIKPKVVVAENVPGLLRRGLDIVVADLTAAGYAVEATRLRAEDLGAPHRRERLFIVAYRDSRRQQGEWSGEIFDCERSAQRSYVNGCCGEAMANSSRVGRREGWAESTGARETGTDEPSCEDMAYGQRQGLEVERIQSAREEQSPAERGGADLAHAENERRERGAQGGREAEHGSEHLDQWPPGPDDLYAWRTMQADAQPSLCRLADGLPPRLARRSAKLKALGNAVVPACAEIIGRRISERMKQP